MAEAGPVVDTEAAQEFMRQALEMIQAPELEAIAGELEVKAARFREALTAEALEGMTRDGLHGVLRSVFSTRRRAGELIDAAGFEPLRTELAALLHGGGPVSERLDRFDERLSTVEPALRRDLGCEALHFVSPGRHWLWTRWMWDPELRTGALPLVTMQEFDLGAATGAGETYLRVGQAVAFVNETGRAVGFTRFGSEAFGVDVYLACVYGVYLYTITRIRMTQEFNKVIPALPQLARRLLGVHRLEI